MSIALDSQQSVNIIDAQGLIQKGFLVVDPKPDRDGLITLVQGETNYRVHPKRIVSSEIQEIKVSQTPAPAVTKQTPSAPKQPKVAPQQIDVADFTKYGELWSRSVDFDGKTQVVAHTLIIIDKGRYISFNTYGGTFGKKGKAPPVQDILDGKPEGYEIKDIAKMRDGLAKRGYIKAGAAATPAATPTEPTPVATPEAVSE